MVAAYYKKVKTDDEYNEIRAKYGDTTSVEAQLAALRSLGLNRLSSAKTVMPTWSSMKLSTAGQ